MDETMWEKFNDFSAKLARIDERTQRIEHEIERVPDMRERLTAVEQRSKSNTHRLDGLYKTAILVATIATIVANVVISALQLAWK